MSIFGKTKGTEMEQVIEYMAKAESDGAMMYQFLARMAREQGLPEVAKKFYNIAMQESIHSGFFSALNGKYDQNFWPMVAEIQKLEASADDKMPEMIEGLRKLGVNEAADELDTFMAQEMNHGKILAELLAEHAPELCK